MLPADLAAHHRRLAARLGVALLVVILPGCSALQPEQPTTLTCAQVPATAPDAGEADPDFTQYGFKTVAAKAQFTPGSDLTVKVSSYQNFPGNVTVSLPKDLYTQPLTFEVLVSDEASWSACARPGEKAILPYAYRVTDPATGKLVGRFDKPAEMTVEDPRIVKGAEYWVTLPKNPVQASPATAQYTITEGKLHAVNTSARIGWIITVPSR